MKPINLDFFEPVHDSLLEGLKDLHPSVIGQNIAFHTPKNKNINLEDCQIAILGVRENRGEQQEESKNSFNFNTVRAHFYALFPGNWELKIVDLGNILPGDRMEDTRYALRETLEALMENRVFPIILGGSQDLTYTQYRAYDAFSKMVNLVNIDGRFDIGDAEAEISDISYVGKMIVDEPRRLFNYSNIGYQTYLNPPEEIDLIESLYFEAHRLGEIYADITSAEPILRDADLVSMDMHAVALSQSHSSCEEPNGFNGREICALARYTGISDHVSSLGLYNLHHYQTPTHTKLAAQILWYVIEGIHYRKNEYDVQNLSDFIKYTVSLETETLIFYKSKRSDRWWVEVPVYVNSQQTQTTYLPCSYKDYQEALQNKIPERWYKARRKNEL